MENIMMTVFNYAQNDREQFLLIKFFEVAVKEEIEYVFEYMYFIHGGSPHTHTHTHTHLPPLGRPDFG